MSVHFQSVSHQNPSDLRYQVYLTSLISDLSSTGCPKKNYTLFWRAVAPLNFELGIKVGGVLESSGSQLFKTVPTFDFWPKIYKNIISNDI